MVSVLRPVCEPCLVELPAELRERFDDAHGRYDVQARIRIQDEVRKWFIARDGLATAGRVITPTVAQPFEDRGVVPEWR